jgi:hypothetical protein
MDQYDIIGAIETYALSQKWLFEYGIDNFYKSIQTNQQFDTGKIILIADFRAQPTKKSYTCLMMLGRKFDSDGQAADLDETSQQKYDRRLKELCQLLDTAIGQIACDNELDLTAGEIVVDINQFAANIDFAVSTNVFVQ